MSVNLPAQLSITIFVFPLVVFNSLSEIIISDRTNMTTQQLKGVLHIVKEHTGCHFSLQSSWKFSVTVETSHCMQGSCLGHWSYLFPSDILSSLCSALCLQPVSWLPVHSLKILNGTAQFRIFAKKKKKHTEEWGINKDDPEIKLD